MLSIRTVLIPQHLTEFTVVVVVVVYRYVPFSQSSSLSCADLFLENEAESLIPDNVTGAVHLEPTWGHR